MKGKPQVQVGPDFIRIVSVDPGRPSTVIEELIRWHQDEWTKNSCLVYQIVEAVTVAAYEPELLPATLERMKDR